MKYIYCCIIVGFVLCLFVGVFSRGAFIGLNRRIQILKLENQEVQNIAVVWSGSPIFRLPSSQTLTSVVIFEEGQHTGLLGMHFRSCLYYSYKEPRVFLHSCKQSPVSFAHLHSRLISIIYIGDRPKSYESRMIVTTVTKCFDKLHVHILMKIKLQDYKYYNINNILVIRW